MHYLHDLHDHDFIICIYLLQTHSFSLLKMNWYHVDYGIQLQFWSHPFPAEKDEEAHLYILYGLSNIFSKFSFLGELFPFTGFTAYSK